ncbi:MAG: hypothetical protein J0G36_07945 [Afipia sp.]|nr:hypothetical protein [Afipia sp.]
MAPAKLKRPASAPVARLLDQVARAMHSIGHDGGLFPAQWTALRYFRDAAVPHNTAMGLARFQGLAFGPVSRSVRTLIEKGLLRKAGSAGRGRSEIVELTSMGRALLKADPLLVVVRAIETMPPEQAESLAMACEAIIAAIQAQKHESTQAAE